MKYVKRSKNYTSLAWTEARENLKLKGDEVFKVEVENPENIVISFNGKIVTCLKAFKQKDKGFPFLKMNFEEITDLQLLMVELKEKINGN